MFTCSTGYLQNVCIAFAFTHIPNRASHSNIYEWNQPVSNNNLTTKPNDSLLVLPLWRVLRNTGDCNLKKEKRQMYSFILICKRYSGYLGKTCDRVYFIQFPDIKKLPKSCWISSLFTSSTCMQLENFTMSAQKQEWSHSFSWRWTKYTAHGGRLPAWRKGFWQN